jgi:hypothetical protein
VCAGSFPAGWQTPIGPQLLRLSCDAASFPRVRLATFRTVRTRLRYRSAKHENALGNVVTLYGLSADFTGAYGRLPALRAEGLVELGSTPGPVVDDVARSTDNGGVVMPHDVASMPLREKPAGGEFTREVRRQNGEGA